MVGTRPTRLVAARASARRDRKPRTVVSHAGFSADGLTPYGPCCPINSLGLLGDPGDGGGRRDAAGLVGQSHVGGVFSGRHGIEMALDGVLIPPGRGTGERRGRTQLVDIVDGGPNQIEEGGQPNPGLRADPLGLAEQRHKMVGGDDRGRVVGGSIPVGHLERPAAEVGHHPANDQIAPRPRTNSRPAGAGPRRRHPAWPPAG